MANCQLRGGEACGRSGPLSSFRINARIAQACTCAIVLPILLESRILAGRRRPVGWYFGYLTGVVCGITISGVCMLSSRVGREAVLNA